jgi:hypothetical protein
MHARYRLVLWFVTIVLVLSMTACGGQSPVIPLVTPPAISVLITRDSCPSLEVQAGMQIAWTNQDDVDRVLILERTNEQGVLVDSGGTDRLQPGDTFSISLEPGKYTYYCSVDRTESGTITVLPGSYPYP